MSRIRRGWALTKKSWGVLREHRELLRFPLYGAAATIVCAAIVVGPGVYLIEDGQTVFGGALAVIGFYLLATIGTFGITAAARAGPDATRTPTTAGASVVQRIEHLRC